MKCTVETTVTVRMTVDTKPDILFTPEQFEVFRSAIVNTKVNVVEFHAAEAAKGFSERYSRSLTTKEASRMVLVRVAHDDAESFVQPGLLITVRAANWQHSRHFGVKLRDWPEFVNMLKSHVAHESHFGTGKTPDTVKSPSAPT